MAVHVQVNNLTCEIGTSEFLFSFFSTVAGNLEPKGWGTRFPIVMRQLYSGALPAASGSGALRELTTIHRELSALVPSKVIWNFENRAALPPWGTQISPDITSLANYFVTSNGKDLIGVLTQCLQELAKSGQGELKIQ
ncbi:MAG: hypothetical protein JNM27_21255 [Leptospirales bacterium]|nr:hypothetical protein [Leptospirales bacterium]